jgi:hypothetical protein
MNGDFARPNMSAMAMFLKANVGMAIAGRAGVGLAKILNHCRVDDQSWSSLLRRKTGLNNQSPWQAPKTAEVVNPRL